MRGCGVFSLAGADFVDVVCRRWLILAAIPRAAVRYARHGGSSLPAGPLTVAAMSGDVLDCSIIYDTLVSFCGLSGGVTRGLDGAERPEAVRKVIAAAQAGEDWNAGELDRDCSGAARGHEAVVRGFWNGGLLPRFVRTRRRRFARRSGFCWASTWMDMRGVCGGAGLRIFARALWNRASVAGEWRERSR